ncbi:TetR family transcriptional regulator C-terminal domain-containing protein [Frigidibacter sp. SD6-1]|uniref:TetR/AcrR family transcriptional regulator n=1 Tax=Frigidibacter sp. SD6-1 TaxID=3032581 RepID=UPI0024DFF5BF|nr:TetR family transcriptional regulator C-terminal domain-containing protein [Frigidibacter sp. SD6-1]
MVRIEHVPKYTRLTGEERRAELVAAGLACMARGGIQDFTVDKICAEAGVSRGLITHHFGSMNGLLAAVYATMYRAATTARDDGRPHLSALLDAFFAPEVFNRDALNIWLALWGQVSVNAELGAEHRRQYAGYLADVASAIAEMAAARGRSVDADGLARALICLVDGLGLQHCIDPPSMSAHRARMLCHALIEPHLGPL